MITMNKSQSVLMIILCFCIALIGCSSLDPNGVYKGDKALYEAEQTIVTGYDVLHTFVKWEDDNRVTLAKWPEITKAADTVRAQSPAWFSTACNLVEAYKANPTTGNRTAMTTAISVIRTAMTETVKWYSLVGQLPKTEPNPTSYFQNAIPRYPEWKPSPYTLEVTNVILIPLYDGPTQWVTNGLYTIEFRN